MRRIIILIAVSVSTMARPELYKEKEDFKYSRSSTDEGSKAGFYGAQRGNMGGNYERAHNMDSQAQHQMSGVVNQVEGELGDGFKARSGSVYTAANSRGTYGSGHYDLSNLKGRNFQEGEFYDNLQSKSSLSQYNNAAATNSRSQAWSSGYGGYHGAGYSDQSWQPGDLQTLDNYQGVGTYGSGHQSNSGHHSQSGYRSHSTFSTSDANSHSGEYDSNVHTKLISAVPVRIVVRPGTRVAIPIGAQTYDRGQDFSIYDANQKSLDYDVSHRSSTYDANQRSSYDQTSRNNEAELLSGNRHHNANKPINDAKHYESSYSYRKEWEKHNTIPANLPTPTENPFPQNSELYEDHHTGTSNHQHDVVSSDSQRTHSSNAHSGFNANIKSTDSQFGHRSDLHSQQYGSLSASNLKAHTNAGYNANFNTDLNSQVEDINTKPKSYHSSYSYHKSWERQGDPYVIEPATNGHYDSQSSQQYSAGTKSGSHKSVRHQSQLDCDEICGHARVPRSYDVSQYQEEFGQQKQNLEDFGQQQSQNLEDFGEQKSLNLEDFGQQQNQNLEDFGQQQSQKLEDFSQQQSQRLEDFGQQQSQNLEDFGQQQSQNLEDFGQQPRQKLEDIGQQQSQDLETFGQQQNQNLEDFGQQQSQNLEDFGQQSQNLENFNQQSQNTWENLEQITQNKNQNFQDRNEDLGQFTQHHARQNTEVIWNKPKNSHSNVDQQIQNKWDLNNIKDEDQQQNQDIENIYTPIQNKLNTQEHTGVNSNENYSQTFENIHNYYQNHPIVSIWEKVNTDSIYNHNLNEHKMIEQTTRFNNFHTQQAETNSFNTQTGTLQDWIQFENNALSNINVTQLYTDVNHDKSSIGTFMHQKPYLDHLPKNNLSNETQRTNGHNNLDLYTENNRHDLTTRNDSYSHNIQTNLQDNPALLNFWGKLDTIEKQLELSYNKSLTNKYNSSRGYQQDNLASEFELQSSPNTEVVNENNITSVTLVDHDKEMPLDIGRGDISSEDISSLTDIETSQEKSHHSNSYNNIMIPAGSGILNVTQQKNNKNSSEEHKSEKQEFNSPMSVKENALDMSLKHKEEILETPGKETFDQPNLDSLGQKNEDTEYPNYYKEQGLDTLNLNKEQQNVQNFDLQIGNIHYPNNNNTKSHNLQTFEHDIEDLKNQNTQDLRQQNDNLEQQNLQDFVQQNLENFEQQGENFEQQNVENYGQQNLENFGQQNSENIEQVEKLEQQNLQDFGQQNLENFEQQNENLQQQNIQDFGQQNENLDRHNIHDFEHQNWNQENQNLQYFRHTEQLNTQNHEQQNQENFANQNYDLQKQSLGQANFNIQNLHELSDVQQQQQNHNFEQIFEKFEAIENIGKNTTPQTEKMNVLTHNTQENSNLQSTSPIISEIKLPKEPVTEKPGFWKSVGNKFVNAKDKVWSWFGS